ncbi:MAG: ABC transporter ATP-binding protein [candidate division WOR-3 bacterium]|nr:MAG: ABC transporter ATP-binding protein [candidate division WOR-3 bacterium]
MEPVIEIHDLTRVYDLGDVKVRALRGVDLTVSRGEFLAIMGASGSGKSTLLNVIGCLDRPTTGRYLLDGEETSRLSRNQYADVRNRKIGFIFQGYNLIARTSALENVELPLLYDRSGLHGPAGQLASAALDRVGLADRVQHVPNQLSGGQQQRVAIARALVNEPALVLADEPTGNLDSRTSVEVMTVFQELNHAGITIVMVTHEPDIARYARRVVVMRDGRITRDYPVEKRGSAAQDLAALPVVDVEARMEAIGQ